MVDSSSGTARSTVVAHVGLCECRSIIAAAAMSFSSVSVITNALRLKTAKL
jgi:cation transport ATPase